MRGVKRPRRNGRGSASRCADAGPVSGIARGTDSSPRTVARHGRLDLLYDNPLVSRYASREMAELWGPQRKFGTWRRLWVALAEAQHELGLPADDGQSPRIRPSSSTSCAPTSTTSTSPRPTSYERELRHDVMAHIHAFGDVAPAARDIIHLGATCCYVTDNTDLILMREGLATCPRPARRRDRRAGRFADHLARPGRRWASPTSSRPS